MEWGGGGMTGGAGTLVVLAAAWRGGAVAVARVPRAGPAVAQPDVAGPAVQRVVLRTKPVALLQLERGGTTGGAGTGGMTTVEPRDEVARLEVRQGGAGRVARPEVAARPVQPARPDAAARRAPAECPVPGGRAAP